MNWMNGFLARATSVAALGLSLMGLPAAAADWSVDHTQSTLGFEASMNGTGFSGQFGRWTATISFDPADLAASKAEVSIDMTSAETGDGTRDAALPQPDWFDTDNFGTATFVASAFRSMGGDAYEADGTLTIRGTSKPVTLAFTLAIADGKAVMAGATTLNRGDFGVGQGEFAGDTPVALAVKVVVSIQATAR